MRRRCHRVPPRVRIAWIAFGPIRVHQGRLESDLASLRYRMLLPARGLRALGHFSDVVQISNADEADSVYERMAADVIVVTKLVPATERVSERFGAVQRLLEHCRAGKVPSVVDVCDDHFQHPYFRALVAAADLVVTPTTEMADVARLVTDQPCAVIVDPYENPWQAPRVALDHLTGSGRLRLLWYGYSNNLPPLLDLLPHLLPFAARVPLDLHVVSQPVEELASILAQWNAQHSTRFSIRFTAWTLEVMTPALAECDAVLIPSRPDDPQKRVKSANRLVEAIRAGRFVVADALPSYEEFAPYAWIGHDLVQGLQWLVEHPTQAQLRLEHGQRYIDQRFAPEVIARLWQDALSGLL
jgi:glycosyltransferase involved in cell wall biosynthesis